MPNRIAVLCAGIAFFANAVAAQEQTGVWRDAATGFAIGGYDPVAYHTRGQPAPGQRRHTHRWGGAAWCFANDGNRAAFADAPHVYAPRYFGFDPVAVAGGRAAEGSPLFWVLAENRLFLFHTAQNRSAFIAEPSRISAEADAKWPNLSGTLANVRDR